jgi:hypothetical protein
MLIAMGCGPSPAPSITPAPEPTPAITPDPHLQAPVTADQIYFALMAGHLNLRPNNATLGPGAIEKRINADLEGWPVRITAYTSTAALRAATIWTAGMAPGPEEAPYAFAALNVLVEFGPITGFAPAAPDPGRQATAAKLVGVLDPLLWPIKQHSVMTIAARTTPPATPTPAPTKPAKTSSPAPSKKP